MAWYQKSLNALSSGAGFVVNQTAKGLAWSGSKLVSSVWTAFTDYGVPIAVAATKRGLKAGIKAAELTAEYVPPFIEKTSQVYNKLHPGVKIPLEVYLIAQYSPFTGIANLAHWTGWGLARFAPDEIKETLKKTSIELLKSGKESAIALTEHPSFENAGKKLDQMVHQLREETPEYVRVAKQTLGHVLKGNPLNAFGQRIGMGKGVNGNPQTHLEKIDQHLTTFAANQPPQIQGAIPLIPNPNPQPLQAPALAPPPQPDANPQPLQAPALAPPPQPDANPQPLQAPALAPPPPPPAAIALRELGMPPPATPAIGPHSPVQIKDQMIKTDQQLKNLSENLSYFIPLYTMISQTGIKDKDPQALSSMVMEASTPGQNGRKPSLKEVFERRYGQELSFFQKCKIWFINLFGSSFLFSKTVAVYADKLFEEVRNRISNTRWTEKGENTERLIDDFMHFLDVYKNATFNYANSKEPTGSLRQYRERAFEKMFGKSLQKICEEFSATITGHLAPYVNYFEGKWFLPRIANWMLNKIVRSIVNHSLPRGVYSAVLQANDSTQPYHLPFAKALTDTLTVQIQKLQAQLDEQPSGPPLAPVPGTKHLKDAIDSLLYVIEFARCTTQESILAKKKKIDEKRKNQGFDAKIQQGIQDSIQKGAHVLLHYLAEPENSEEMFANLFQLANDQFTRGELVTQEDFQTSKNKLDLVVRNLGKRLAKEAVEEEIQASRPEQIEKMTQEAFQAHQGDAQTTLIHLQTLSQTISQKTVQLAQGWNSENDILLELDSMHRVLKAFSTKEQIANDLKNLPEADREGILRPLIPLYQNIEKQSSRLLRLQELQLLHKAHFHLAQDLHQIDEILISISAANPPENALESLPLLQQAVEDISKALPKNATEIVEITGKIQVISTALQGADTQRKNLNHLRNLDQRALALKQSMEQNRPNRRKINLEQLRQLLKAIPAADAARLTPLLRGLNDLKLPVQRPAFEAAWNVFRQEVDEIQADYLAQREASLAAMPPFLPFQEWIRRNEQSYHQYHIDNFNGILREEASLRADIDELKTLIANLQRENQLHLTPRHFGLIGGTALGILSFFHPALAATAGIAAHAGLKQIGPFLKGAALPGIKIGAQTLLGAAATSAISAIPGIGPPLVATGATLAGVSAGNQMIDGIVEGGQEKVYQEILDFCSRAYDFALSGDIYKPAAKIAMQEVIASFKTSA